MADRDLAARPWIVIRQDANGNRYRVGHYATRAEALRMASRLEGGVSGEESAVDDTGTQGDHGVQRYLVERVSRGSGVQA